MKRTNWFELRYWHYYLDVLPGRILCGLFHVSGKNIIEIFKDVALCKGTVLVLS